MRREKPSARRIEWAIQFARQTVSISEQEVGAPLGAIARDIEKSESRRLREGHVFAFGAVPPKSRLQSRRPEYLLMQNDHEHLLSVVACFYAVAGGVELPDSGEPRQELIELVRIQGVSDQGLQEF